MQTWDYSIFWKETMKQIRDSVSEQEYNMWFTNMSYESSSENNITINVPSLFYQDQMKQRYQKMIEEKLEEISGNTVSIGFNIKKRPNLEQQGSREKTPTLTQNTERKHPQLRSDYTFDSFVVGENNRFAANAALAIAKNPGRAYNPCLIYGGVGLGKTHLLHSIGNSIFSEFSESNVMYITAEQFINDFIQSIKMKTQQKFKNKYRYVDVLLIDDIHDLQKKDGTQEELFHTFNALYDANKQMLFTCDRPVTELKNLSDRLRNRFVRGLNVDLQPPSFETRVAILEQKVKNRSVHINDDVIEYISHNVTTNIRDLEAALTKLIAYAELVNKNIVLDVAKEQLKEMFVNPIQSSVTIDIIQRIVADYFDCTTSDLKSKKRTRNITLPRQIAMYIIRELTEYSTTEVGLEFGGRDHTTVMHSCQKIEDKIKIDPHIETTINKLVKLIKEYRTSV